MIQTWKPRGLIAAAAGSVGADYTECGVAVERVGSVAVITIRGPIESHPNSCGFADYDSVYLAFLQSRDASAIVLDIDSPGGMCAGNFECARSVRGLVLPPVYAVANFMACSAAYALACVADHIFAPPTATVGSVGVRSGVMSWSRANDANGIDIRLTSSGDYKLDGDPDLPIDDGAVARNQAQVDTLAEVFFVWVSERRNGLDARALQGDCFLGSQACELGLTDGVATLGQVLGALLIDTKGESI